MKITFIFGGMPHYLVHLLNLLQNTESLDVSVILPENKSKTIGAAVLENYANCTFKVIRTEEYLFLGQKPYLKNLLKIFKQEQPEIVIIGWPFILGYFFDIPLRLWLKKNQVKTVFRSIPYQIPLYHEAGEFYAQKGFYDENMNLIKADTWKKKIKYKLITEINKLYFRWVDAHLNYTSLAYEILESYGVAKEKIFVTYNSGDTDELFRVKNKILAENSNKKQVIHVGRLVKWKKVDLLIEAFFEVQKNIDNAELLIVGDGPEKQNLQQQVENLGISHKVIFLGAIHNPETLGKYLMNACVYVLAGAGGLSINDAMAFGTPIICSVADGTEKDLVIEHETGLYFRENDAKDLAEKILLCLKNEDFAKKMGKNAENLIQNKINIHTVAANFIKCFNAVTQNRYQLKYEH